jgi:hypothetical protein
MDKAFLRSGARPSHVEKLRKKMNRLMQKACIGLVFKLNRSIDVALL